MRARAQNKKPSPNNVDEHDEELLKLSELITSQSRDVVC